MLNVPTGSDEVVNFARCVVGLTVSVPSTVVPFLKVTAPLGEPERTGFTVAVNVSGLPCVDGAAVEGTGVVVFVLIVNGACLVVSVLPALSTLWNVAVSAPRVATVNGAERSEEHTSELQSLRHLVCRLLLEKK